jgi:hypothetical protein
MIVVVLCMHAAGRSGIRETNDEGTDGSDFDQTAALLSQMEIKSQPDRD